MIKLAERKGMKLDSKTKKGNFIYLEIEKGKKTNVNLIILLSGFSGSKELPLFEKASSFFKKNNFDVLRLNFCNDNEGKNNPKALSIKDISFNIYLAELKNVIDNLAKDYKKIILVGHSFGTIISLLFLKKYKGLTKKIELIIWEPSLLPWEKDGLEKDFPYEAKQKAHVYKEDKNIILNKTFFKELTTTDSLNLIKILDKKFLVISAKDSAEEDAQKYFTKIKNKKKSRLIVMDKTDHYFSGVKTQKKLFKETSNFIENLDN